MHRLRYVEDIPRTRPTPPDGNGMIAEEELTAFFEDRDDGDLVWTFVARGRGSRADSGAPEGEMAPDFTLAPPKGGYPVTLSTFRGKRPVALVFGSYT